MKYISQKEFTQNDIEAELNALASFEYIKLEKLTKVGRSAPYKFIEVRKLGNIFKKFGDFTTEAIPIRCGYSYVNSEQLIDFPSNSCSTGSSYRGALKKLRQLYRSLSKSDWWDFQFTLVINSPIKKKRTTDFDHKEAELVLVLRGKTEFIVESTQERLIDFDEYGFDSLKGQNLNPDYPYSYTAVKANKLFDDLSKLEDLIDDSKRSYWLVTSLNTVRTVPASYDLLRELEYGDRADPRMEAIDESLEQLIDLARCEPKAMKGELDLNLDPKDLLHPGYDVASSMFSKVGMEIPLGKIADESEGSFTLYKQITAPGLYKLICDSDSGKVLTQLKHIEFESSSGE